VISTDFDLMILQRVEYRREEPALTQRSIIALDKTFKFKRPLLLPRGSIDWQ
jgi:hypothetical protein